MPDRNRVVVVSAPQKAGVAVPDEAKLAAVIKSAGGAHADGLRRRREHAAAARDAADARHGRRRRPTKTPRHHRVALSNGVRVVLKPTTFKQDEILFRAFSPGGTSLAERSRTSSPPRPPTRWSPQGGLGTLERDRLDKKLAGKTAVVRADIDEMDEGLRGGRCAAISRRCSS